MRTTYEPFKQGSMDDYNKSLSILQEYVKDVVKANDRLTEKVNELIPTMVKEHGNLRPIIKAKLTSIARELHGANGQRVAAFSEAYTLAMAEVEALRHEYHGQQKLAKQMANKEKEEFASLVIDQGSNTYYYMELVPVPQPNGNSILKPRRKNITEDHPWVRDSLAVAKARGR